MSKISIIAAIADNFVIGKSNDLPWNLPADLKHFKELTTGHAIVMGKHTFESLPKGPLPNRKNIVLTSVMSEGVNQGYFEADSLEDALFLCDHEEKVFIIGGARVYNQCINKVKYMYITWIHQNFTGDAYFPAIDFNDWEEVKHEDFEADTKNPYPYTFSEYKRK